jgi:predicted permease
VVLLIAAGLLLRSYWRERGADLGCDPSNVLTMSFSLPAAKYDTPEKVVAFSESLTQRLRALPGVRAAGLGYIVPGAGQGGDNNFIIPEHPAPVAGTALPDALYRAADPGYFNTLRIPLLSGRFFTRDDRFDRPRTIIISRRLARQYFPGEDPLGKHIFLGATGITYEIVGVVGDTLHRVGQPIQPTMYLPVLEGDSTPWGLALVVRTAGDPLKMAVPVQKVFAQLDPQQPVEDVFTLQQIVERSLGNASLSATLVLAFAALSLLLASVGLYGVLSYLTTQRTAEIGVRMALGAQRPQVLRLMLGDGLRPALYGLVLGLAAAAATVRLIRSMLYQTESLDPAVFAGVAAMLLAVAALACLIPAWRASRINPMLALRMD